MGVGESQPGAGDAGRDLPALGVVAERWLSLRSVEDHDLDEAVGLLGHDAVLCEPVLGWCRARAGVSGPRVTSPHRAVIILGVPGVRSAVVGVSAIFALNGMRSGGSPVDLDGFWTHALGVSCLCAHLGAGMEGVDPDEAALAGLLHDAGKLVLASQNPAGFTKAMEGGEQRGRQAAVALRECCGVDHHTVGKRLCEAWGLPAGVRDAVWMHGQSAGAVPASSARRVVALVTLAKAWARANHLGWSGEAGEVTDLPALCAAAGVSADELEEAMAPVLEGVRERGRALGLGGGAGVDPIAWSAAAATRRSAELAARLRDISRASEESRTALTVLASFQDTVRIDDEPEAVVGAIGKSACELMGVGRVAVVWQTGPDEAWSLTLVSAAGVPERGRKVDAPPANAQIRRPGDLASAHAAQVLMASELGWLARLLEHLREAGTPALLGAGATGDERGASCLVLAPVPRLRAEGAWVGTVTRAWAWALDAASRTRAARTLGEELTEANRALAATQDELASKQTLVRLGQMAAGMAHELNNPLTVIRGRAQMISEKASTPKQKEDATLISEAAREVSDMITSMHLLSTPPKPKVRECDPMLVLRDAIDRARSRVPLAAQKSRVRVNADGVHQSARFDPELVAQALCEPIANALLARPGGDVHISVESEAFTDRLKVRVIDRGPGMSARALTHAFDPFFSEQPAGRRAGLGLSRARSLVELMGGQIEIGNNPGDIGGAFAEVIIPEAKQGRRAA